MALKYRPTALGPLYIQRCVKRCFDILAVEVPFDAVVESFWVAKWVAQHRTIVGDMVNIEARIHSIGRLIVFVEHIAFMVTVHSAVWLMLGWWECQVLVNVVSISTVDVLLLQLGHESFVEVKYVVVGFDKVECRDLLTNTQELAYAWV